jgi:hypothetical protein
MVTQSDAVGGSRQLVKIIATAGHVLALAARTDWWPRRRWSSCGRTQSCPADSAVLDLVTLSVITSSRHRNRAVRLAVGGIRSLVTSLYGLVLLVKVSFGLMLLMAPGRRQQPGWHFSGCTFPATLFVAAAAYGAWLW